MEGILQLLPYTLLHLPFMFHEAGNNHENDNQESKQDENQEYHIDVFIIYMVKMNYEYKYMNKVKTISSINSYSK